MPRILEENNYWTNGSGRRDFYSTIIPTIGRRTLSRALDSVLNQDFSSVDYDCLELLKIVTSRWLVI